MTAARQNKRRVDESTHLLLSDTETEFQSIPPPFGESIPRKWPIQDELQQMTLLAIPVVGTYLLEIIPGVVSILLVGNLQEENAADYMAATGLAVSFTNLFGISIGLGLASAMDTLCSQAYGAKETRRMGIYLQTGMIVLGITSLLLYPVFRNGATMLIAGLDQPVALSQLAGSFIRCSFPGIPFFFLYELLRKVLQAKNCAIPMVFVAVGANVINAGLGYYLVHHTSWGWLGAAVARTVSYVSFSALLIPYIVWSGHHRDFWTGIELDKAWTGVGQFLQLGLPGMLQVCSESWAFQCAAFFCGMLPNAVVDIGANAVIYNIASVAFMFYFGISIASNVRIGNALGANDVGRAKVAAGVSLALVLCAALALAAGLLLGRNIFPRLFTKDHDISELSATLIVVAAFFQLPDAMNAALQGIFRGSGRQSLGANLNFFAFYVVGLPLGVVLSFGLHMDVVGLWIGLSGGLLVIAIVGTILVAHSDWNACAEEAQNRLYSSP